MKQKFETLFVSSHFKEINEMSNLYETFPEIFKNNMMINFVLGLYAQSIGVADYAIAHYNKALSVWLPIIIVLLILFFLFYI
jgi:hypothetical protein